MDRKTKGRLAELEVQSYFLKTGYEVYLPAFDNSKYDMIVSKDGLVERVSIKFCATMGSAISWRVNMTQVSRRANNTTAVDKFDATLYDLIAVYIEPEDRVVVLPASSASTRILTIRTLESQTTGA